MKPFTTASSETGPMTLCRAGHVLLQLAGLCHRLMCPCSPFLIPWLVPYRFVSFRFPMSLLPGANGCSQDKQSRVIITPGSKKDTGYNRDSCRSLLLAGLSSEEFLGARHGSVLD